MQDHPSCFYLQLLLTKRLHDSSFWRWGKSRDEEICHNCSSHKKKPFQRTLSLHTSLANHLQKLPINCSKEVRHLQRGKIANTGWVPSYKKIKIYFYNFSEFKINSKNQAKVLASENFKLMKRSENIGILVFQY